VTTFRSRTLAHALIAVPLVALLLATSTSGAIAAGVAHPASSGAQKALAYVVPAGVTSVTVDMAGATGRDVFCSRATGRGGEVTATIPVTPGEELQINIGDNVNGSASGNASDIRRNPYTLDDRLVVAGGGGSNSDHGGLDAIGNCKQAPTGGFGEGGDGGAPDGLVGRGEAAGLCDFPGGHGGGGGTHDLPGAGGSTCGPGGVGAPGTFGTGGAGGQSGVPGIAPCDTGGAGGDGWYGGGGGGGTLGAVGSPGGCTDASGQNLASRPMGGGGGGGSSYAVPEATGVVYQVGVNPDPFGWVTVAVGGVPVVGSVSPRAGPLGGGRTVTILGSHLIGATAVRFGTTKGTHLVVRSAGRITVRTPAHAAGVVDVRVVTAGGTSAKVKADRYTYAKAPAITDLSPRSGSTRGGKTVTVLGRHLTRATMVVFGTTKGTHVVVVSARKITVRTPAHAKGVVAVRVTTPGGTSAKVKADRYTFR
jgi:hypothetical protein